MGASGWLGGHLIERLLLEGWQVVGFSRSERKSRNVQWRQWNGSDDINLEGVDALVNLAGEPIDQRWTGARKKEFAASRVILSERLSLATRGSEVKVFLNSSAIGFYGDRGDEKLTEQSAAGEGYLADLCAQWEEAVDVLSDIRVCYLRTGVVLGRGGRAWKKVERIFKFGLGGKLGSGRQWMPWIHLDDEIGAILHCLKHKVSGPVNLVSPGCVTNAEFTSAVGKVFGRPTILPVPAFGLKMLLGEFAEEALLASVRVVPGVLESSGYQFKFPELAGALKELAGD
ncbi:MAG: TIGR01777 family oxidoreductase [Akkermansiaceae bacterium]